MARPSNWNHSVTKLIRVPELFAKGLLNLARQWDQSGHGPYYLAGNDDEGYILLRNNSDKRAKYRNYTQPDSEICRGTSFADMSTVKEAMNSMEAGPHRQKCRY